MVEKVFLSEVKIPNAKSVYELVKEEHAHMVCSSCGHIEDVIVNSSNILEEATVKSNFKIQSAEIVLSGLCPKCSK